MGTDITIRKMTPQDMPRVQEITDEVFRPMAIVAKIEDRYTGLPHGWLELKMQQLYDDVKADADGCMVAECEGEVAGYVTSARDARSGIGRIPNLAVSKRFQGRGISKILLQHAQDYLQENGMVFAKIETLESNQLCREYYPRLGFEEVARQIHFVKKL